MGVELVEDASCYSVDKQNCPDAFSLKWIWHFFDSEFIIEQIKCFDLKTNKLHNFSFINSEIIYGEIRAFSEDWDVNLPNGKGLTSLVFTWIWTPTFDMAVGSGDMKVVEQLVKIKLFCCGCLLDWLWHSPSFDLLPDVCYWHQKWILKANFNAC